MVASGSRCSWASLTDTGNVDDLAALVEAGIVPEREEHAAGRPGAALR